MDIVFYGEYFFSDVWVLYVERDFWIDVSVCVDGIYGFVGEFDYIYNV